MKWKWTTSTILASIGFGLLFLVFVGGIIVAILFTFPQSSFMGMKAVNERDTQIVYGGDALKSAFENGNFIIESENCNIEVVMQTNKQMAENTIVVNESATGIAFNSFNRTLIEWTRTQVDGVPYYRVKVLEPTGLVFSNKPTTVYFNLPQGADYATKKYNFILKNKYSAVNFSFGDAIGTSGHQLHIDNLIVESANSVTIPRYEKSTIDVNHVEIHSNKTKFTCNSTVKGDVSITGSSGTQVFGTITGNVEIKGGNGNDFRAEQTGNVLFENLSGKLTITQKCGALNVTTSTAAVRVSTAGNKVKMLTDTGNLQISELTYGGLDFEATTSASVKVSTKLVGDVKIRNKGIGSIDIGGVDGNVDIESSVKSGGTISVKFDTSEERSVRILGYDGNISVSNITGFTDIQVRDPGLSGAAGMANIQASFNKITNDNNYICAGGYGDSPAGIANVTVTLNSSCNNFRLTVGGTRSAWAYPKAGDPFELRNGATTEIDNGNAGGMIGRLLVSTPADFKLR